MNGGTSALTQPSPPGEGFHVPGVLKNHARDWPDSQPINQQYSLAVPSPGASRRSNAKAEGKGQSEGGRCTKINLDSHGRPE